MESLGGNQIVYSSIVLTEGNHENQDNREIILSIPEVCNHEYNKWLLVTSSYSFSILMICLSEKIPLPYALIPLILVDFYKILVNSIKIFKYKDSLNKIRQREIIEDLGSFITEVAVILINPCDGHYYIFAVIPLALGTFSGYFIISICQNKCQFFSDIIYFFFKITRLFAVIGVALNYYENLVSKNQLINLMPMWLCLIVLGIIIIGHLFSAINFFCSGNPLQKTQLLGASFILVSLILIFTSFSVYLYSAIELDLSDMIYFPLAVLSLFSLVAIIFKNKLLDAVFQYLEDTSPNSFNQTSPGSKGNSKFIMRFLSGVTRRFFKPISNSYFSETEYIGPVKNRKLSLKQRKISNRNVTMTQKDDQSNTVQINLDSNCISVETCMLCIEKYSNALLMGCGHGGLCFECALSLQKSTGCCHICRSNIEKVLKTLPHTSGLIEVIVEYEEVKSSN